MRGYWWSPDGGALLVARVDDAPVHALAHRRPREPRPRAHGRRLPGGRHAERAGHRCDVVGLGRQPGRRRWDAGRDEYLAARRLGRRTGCSIVVQPRDQRGAARAARRPGHRRDRPRARATPTRPGSTSSPACPAAPPPARCCGSPTRRRRAPAGRRRRAGHPADPAGPRACSTSTATPCCSARPTTRSRSALWTWSAADGLAVPHPGARRARRAAAPAGRWSSPGSRSTPTARSTTVRPARRARRGRSPRSRSRPGWIPRVTLRRPGERALPTALLLPSWHEPGTPLPVLMDPYGGPHAQRVVAARDAHLTSQWFAEQGFAVVVVDGRGTPGRGPAFERAVHGDLAAPVLDDQVDALHAVAAEPPRPRPDAGRHPRLVVRRATSPRWPCCAARTSSTPRSRARRSPTGRSTTPTTPSATSAAPTRTRRRTRAPRCSPDAAKLTRPLLLVHGLADDNVVAAHTLRLSSALLAGGRPHSVLPLSGVTHMTPQEVVAENLLLLQVEFLRDALGIAGRLPRGERQRLLGAASRIRRAARTARPRAPRAATRPPRRRAPGPRRRPRWRAPRRSRLGSRSPSRQHQVEERRQGRRADRRAEALPGLQRAARRARHPHRHVVQGHRHVRRDHQATADARPAAARAPPPSPRPGRGASGARPRPPRCRGARRSARSPSAAARTGRRGGRRTPPTRPTPARTG